MRIVIVGNGIAGNEVAFCLRKNDLQAQITIISAEKYVEYDPCALPYYLSDEIQEKYLYRKTLSDYQKNNIKLVLEDRVIDINVQKKHVLTESHNTFAYDKLVLAHGGKLFIPPIEGVDKKGVFGGKQLWDSLSLKNHRGQKAVVIGSGAIGVEIAVALKQKGYEVTIVELQSRIMPTLFDQHASHQLERVLIQKDIHIMTQEKVLRIEGHRQVERVVTDKRIILCDTVIVATGVILDKSFIERTGLECNRGIKVNDTLMTNIQDIYACGDCVETRDANTGEYCSYQLKHNALEQAAIVARNLQGASIQYPGSYAYARIHFFDTHAATFGQTLAVLKDQHDIEIIEDSRDDHYIMIILRKNKIIGAQAIGQYARSFGFLMRLMSRQEDIQLLRKNWAKITDLHSLAPWFYRKIGRLLRCETKIIS